jgi:hypothetical protein
VTVTHTRKDYRYRHCTLDVQFCTGIVHWMRAVNNPSIHPNKFWKCRSEGLLHNPHAICGVRLPVTLRSYGCPRRRLYMFVTRNPLHVIRIPLSASDGSCSRHPNDRDARAHHKECCTPRLPRVNVKSIAPINGPTNACQPQTRGRRVRTDCVDERPRSPHHARAIVRV